MKTSLERLMAVILLAGGCYFTTQAADRGVIQSGETQTGVSINGPSYMDTWTFSATAGDRVLIAAVTTSGSLNTQIILYPPTGMAAEVDSVWGDFVDHRVLASGVYTIVIADYGLSKAGGYNLTFLKLPGAANSAADPDGGVIAPGATTNGRINATTDLDAFQFYANAGDRVLISAVTTNGELNTQILLYPPNGGAAEVDSVWSDFVDHPVQASGLYTIVICDYGLSKTGGYNLTLLKLPGPVSSTGDPDGGAITSGQTTGGRINSATDLDAFQFYANAGDRVLISAVTTNGTLNTQILLYPPNGGAAEADSVWGDFVDHRTLASGVYTIVICDYGLSKAGGYNLTLLKLPGPVNSASDPDGGLIASGQTTHGRINTATDLDAFQFYANAGDRVLISAVTTNGTLNTQILLYPPNGGAAEVDSVWGDFVDHQAQASGLYTIVVVDYGLSKAGSYELSLTMIPPGLRPGISNPLPVSGAGLLAVPGTLRWDALADATGYDVFFGENGVGPLTKVASNLPSPSVSLPTVITGRVYAWQVVAHTASGDVAGPHWWFTVVAQPSLQFFRSGGKLVVAWPTNASGTLEATTDLVNPVWLTVPGTPSVVGGLNVITNTASGLAKFFRLRKS